MKVWKHFVIWYIHWWLIHKIMYLFHYDNFQQMFLYSSFASSRKLRITSVSQHQLQILLLFSHALGQWLTLASWIWPQTFNSESNTFQRLLTSTKTVLKTCHAHAITNSLFLGTTFLQTSYSQKNIHSTKLRKLNLPLLSVRPNENRPMY